MCGKSLSLSLSLSKERSVLFAFGACVLIGKGKEERNFTAEAQRGKRALRKKERRLNTKDERPIPASHKSRITNHGRTE